MTHVFLTGDIQVGKSTAIRRFLSELPDSTDIRGFRSISNITFEDGSRPVYLVPASEKEPLLTSDRICLHRGPTGFRPDTGVFNTLGVQFLEEAEKGDLILMDEIGRAESHAEAFAQRIRELLSCSTPILGVVQKAAKTPLAEAIRCHPEVTLITVTKENRDDIPLEIKKLLG